jgi:hypothetical protein
MDYSKYLKTNDNQIKISDEPLPKDINFIWLISGRRGSGKSNLLLNALGHKIFYKNYFDNIIFVSPTARNDKKFGDLVEEVEEMNNFYNDLDEDILTEIIDKIKGFNDNFKKKREPRNLIIFDDCIHLLAKSTQKSRLHEIITTNRHLKSSIIITTQRFKNINTLIRSNVDMISFFKNDNIQDKKLFCDEYDINREILEAVCKKNHDFMHISYTSGVPLYYDKFNIIK